VDCDEHEGGSSNREEEEEGDECNLQPLRGFAEVHAINKTVKTF
jgi:hypothetical protein